MSSCRSQPVLRKLLLLCLLALGGGVSAQDIHFSQVDVDPLLFNPGYSGFFDGKARFGMVYRNQWASVSDPFQTFAATAEVALLPGRYRRNGLNLGLFVYRDKAGTLGYGTTAANAILSFYQALDGRNSNLLSVAVEGGYGQQSYDPAEARLYDPAERLEGTSVSYPALGAGVAWYYQPFETFCLKVGLSGRNLNRPNISYLGMDDTYLERKWNGFARAECLINPSWSLLPLAAVQLQNHYHEYILGLDAKWYYDRSAARSLSYSAGLSLRWGDALIADIATEYNNLLVSLSYDANISTLATASHTIGAIELAIVYHLSKAQAKTKAIPCATF